MLSWGPLLLWNLNIPHIRAALVGLGARRDIGTTHEFRKGLESELELGLIQTHMTQKPLLWVEVGAHAVRKRSE
jgi:hypothetical protein